MSEYKNDINSNEIDPICTDEFLRDVERRGKFPDVLGVVTACYNLQRREDAESDLDTFKKYPSLKKIRDLSVKLAPWMKILDDFELNVRHFPNVIDNISIKQYHIAYEKFAKVSEEDVCMVFPENHEKPMLEYEILISTLDNYHRYFTEYSAKYPYPS